MEFSKIFRQNRKRLGYTQDEIASRLSVTPQAVSKWENSSAMPDVTLIVPISRLFGITTDELLGNELKASEEILDELDATSILDVDIREKYKKYLDMLKLYPNSKDLLVRLLGCTAEVLARYGENLSEDEKNELISKAEVFSNEIRVIGEKIGSNYITYSHAFLADVYASAGKYEKAESEIGFLPYARYNKARMLGNLRHREKRYDEAIELYQESISDGLYWLLWDVERLASSCWHTNGSNAVALKIFKLEYDLIHLLYEDNNYYLPLTGYFLSATIKLAAQQARLGKHENAYIYLDEIIEIIKQYDECYGKTFETGCVLYPNAMQPFDKVRNRKRSYKGWLLNCLSWNSFENLKVEDRFADYLKRIEALK